MPSSPRSSERVPAAVRREEADPELQLSASYARYFSLLVDHHEEVEFLADLAEGLREGRPACRVLELGCGPGRISHALAAIGHEVVGLDLSPAMVAIARSEWEAARLALAEAGAKPLGVLPEGTSGQPDAAGRSPGRLVGSFRVVKGDFGAPPGEVEAAGPFDLVLASSNTIPLALDVDHQRRTLAAAAKLLRPGGVFVSEQIHPPGFFGEDAYVDGELEYVATVSDPATRTAIDWSVVYAHDRPRQHLRITSVIDEIPLDAAEPVGPGARLGSHTFTDVIRYATVEEWTGWLEAAGFSRTESFATFERDPLMPDEPMWVSVARKAD